MVRGGKSKASSPKDVAHRDFPLQGSLLRLLLMSYDIFINKQKNHRSNDKSEVTKINSELQQTVKDDLSCFLSVN